MIGSFCSASSALGNQKDLLNHRKSIKRAVKMYLKT